jgi:hypothetical protein
VCPLGVLLVPKERCSWKSRSKFSIEINSKETEAEELDGQVQTAYRENQEFYQQATQHAKSLNDAKTKTSQVQIFRDSIQSMLETMNILKGMLASGGSAGLTPRRFRRRVEEKAGKLREARPGAGGQWAGPAKEQGQLQQREPSTAHPLYSRTSSGQTSASAKAAANLGALCATSDRLNQALYVWSDRRSRTDHDPPS